MTVASSSRLNAISEKPTVLVIQPDAGARAWIEQSLLADGLHFVSFESALECAAGADQAHLAGAILPAPHADDGVFQLQCTLAGRGVAVLHVALSRDIDSCVRAMRAGALDYLTWPCDARKLRATVRQAIDLTSVASANLENRNNLMRRFEGLTPREREVFALVSGGMLNKVVARQLSISEITVQVHRGRVMRKMQARNFADLVRMSDSLGVSTVVNIQRRAPAARPRLPTPDDSAVPFFPVCGTVPDSRNPAPIPGVCGSGAPHPAH